MRIPRWMLKQRLTLEPYLGDSAYGPRYGEPVELRCRVEHKVRQIRRPNGQEVTATARAWFEPDAAVPVESRVTFAGTRYLVLAAGPIPGPRGDPHHIEADLG